MYIATDLLGPSLEDLFNLCGKGFSLKTSLMIFYQLIERIEYMHQRNLIHRDLKPENIMLGLGPNSNVVHLIDFGLTRSVIDSKTGQHLPFVKNKNLIGTCRYVSINAHLGYEMSRRDDLLTMGNVMLYLFKGYLPWQSLSINKNSARFKALGEAKKWHYDNDLFDGCPPVFRQYMQYCTALKFEEMPDF